MRIVGYVATNKVGSKCEFECDVEEAELEGLTQQERLEYIEQQARDMMFEHIEWSYEVEP